MQNNKKMPYRGSAKAVGAFLPNVTKKAFQNFGFPAAALLTDWPAIVGPQMAAYTNPEKVKWPKVSQDDLDDDSRPSSEAGGTLLLRVDGPLAIELQHQSDQLLDRINGYFGYRAIAALRILQAPLNEVRLDPSKMAATKPRQVLSKTRRAELASVDNPRLRVALETLARRVAPN